MSLKHFLLIAAFISIFFVEQTLAGTTDPSMASAGLRMFWGLLVVLGIILIIYGLARKWLSFLHSNDKSRIKVLEIRPLMPKKSLCLVEVRGKEYLLGLGNETITLLSGPEDNTKQNFSTTLETATEQHEQKPL